MRPPRLLSARGLFTADASRCRGEYKAIICVLCRLHDTFKGVLGWLSGLRGGQASRFVEDCGSNGRIPVCTSVRSLATAQLIDRLNAISFQLEIMPKSKPTPIKYHPLAPFIGLFLGMGGEATT